jgi:two-component system LytT family sensor kinase
VNTVGHSAGVVIFGLLLYLFLVNWLRAREGRSSLPSVAAALAMFWNLGSLIALASGPSSGKSADIIVAASFSVLSVLPAVLLHISLGRDHRPLWTSGYVLSSVAVALHASDLATGAPRFHYAALLLVTVGFGGLTIISVLLGLRQENRAAGSRLAGAMALFLLAISFAHFGADHPRQAWSGEIAFHHAGIPLALLVLLQDYRFLLLDAFLRFIVNASLAAAAVLLATRAIQSPELTEHLQHPFDAGLLFVSACLVLTVFVYARNRMQGFLTRVLFLRSNVDDALRELQQLGRAAASEAEYLQQAAETMAHFLHAARFTLTDQCSPMSRFSIPVAVLDPRNWKLPAWVQAVVPLRFSRGDARYLLLGPREGGRRYLSEDFVVLARLEAAVVEQVEQLRGAQMQNLVSQAELKALQAQINPHFFFNSLNTLYGTIDRNNSEARRLVLNLSDVFRYLLRSDRTFIAIEEELRIVRAYLEIEELRLGSKLRSELDVDESLLRATIPLLSIQPLVENAVKHGVASRMGNGFVRLTIQQEPGGIAIRVSNSGECDTRILANSEGGVGLMNVRRRLALCYSEQTRIEAKVCDGTTTVGFVLPFKAAPDRAAAALKA